MDDSAYLYGDLFDLENRPGAGVRLWGKTVAAQFERVVDANHRHRLNHDPGREKGAETDSDAEAELHAGVYFLILAIRRVLRFHDAIAARLDDPRLRLATEDFERVALNAKSVRDLFEHLDDYVLGTGNRQKSGEIPQRVSPILYSRWDCDNVVVKFGAEQLDVTVAAKAAVALSETTATVWEEHIEQARTPAQEPDLSDGVVRMFEPTFGITSVIGGDDENPQIQTGILLDVRVRPATSDEIADLKQRGELPT